MGRGGESEEPRRSTSRTVWSWWVKPLVI
jgi:hypothetical protein